MKNFLNNKTKRTNLITFLVVIVAYAVMQTMYSLNLLTNSMKGQLIPICTYIVLAVSLNLVVGISGELSLGHAGFMSVGAFSGVITAMSLQNVIPNGPLRLAIAMIVGAAFAALAGFVVGIPVLRLRGDYLAIVTLAFGEIIKDIMNCLVVGVDKNGLHMALNISGKVSIDNLGLDPATGVAIIKGAQGATGTTKLATFTAGFVLVMIALIVVLNLVRSRAGRAILAIRDNRIAAESVGINITTYKMMAFVTSAALAGAAGALYSMNYSNMAASKFDFNTSILVLVYVVLGGLGRIWGSVIAATVLYVLPEALREFADYRMLVYAVVLILVMLLTNNKQIKGLLGKVIPKRKGDEVDG